jgi:hypothetical protein
VLEFQIFFDMEKYKTQTSEGKKQIIFDTLISSMTKMSQIFNWDAQAINNAFASMRELNLVNEGYLLAKAYNKNKKCSAQLFYVYDLDKITFYIDLLNRKGQVQSRYYFFETLPHVMEYYKYLGNLKWITDSEIHLLPKYGNYLKTITINDCCSNILAN